jgi:hypothetical protein
MSSPMRMTQLKNVAEILTQQHFKISVPPYCQDRLPARLGLNVLMKTIAAMYSSKT